MGRIASRPGQRNDNASRPLTTIVASDHSERAKPGPQRATNPHAGHNPAPSMPSTNDAATYFLFRTGHPDADEHLHQHAEFELRSTDVVRAYKNL
ncbi:MAG: hypothetical protein ACYC0H_12550, partial [Solirubrobacteraceae bacterium]